MVSRLDCHSWTPEGLLRWERSLRYQCKEWEAEKDRIVSHCEEKIRIVESQEDSLRFWERDLEFKAMELDDRESAVMARELEYSNKEEQIYSDAFRFRRDYHCNHKVRFVCYSTLVISVGFRIVWIEMVMDQLLDHSKISVGMITIRPDTL